MKQESEILFEKKSQNESQIFFLKTDKQEISSYF